MRLNYKVRRVLLMGIFKFSGLYNYQFVNFNAKTKFDIIDCVLKQCFKRPESKPRRSPVIISFTP